MRETYPSQPPINTIQLRNWLTKTNSKVFVESLAANSGTHNIALRIVDNNSVSDADGVKEAWYDMTLKICYRPNNAPVCPSSLPMLELDN